MGLFSLGILVLQGVAILLSYGCWAMRIRFINVEQLIMEASLKRRQLTNAERHSFCLRLKLGRETYRDNHPWLRHGTSRESGHGSVARQFYLECCVVTGRVETSRVVLDPRCLREAIKRSREDRGLNPSRKQPKATSFVYFSNEWQHRMPILVERLTGLLGLLIALACAASVGAAVGSAAALGTPICTWAVNYATRPVGLARLLACVVTPAWSLKDFDDTLGFPGEGPAVRTGPYGRGGVLDDLPTAHTWNGSRSSSQGVDAAPGPPVGGEETTRAVSRSRSPIPASLEDGMRGLGFDESMGSSSRQRLYCPVPGCPDSNCRRAAGWASKQSLRSHVEEHATGRLMGVIPDTWMRDQNLEQCSVCSRLLSQRFGGTCPRCRPALQRDPPSAAGSRPVPEDWPSLEEVFTLRIPTKAYVPKAARKDWAQCLAASLSRVRHYNDEKAWIELLSLPQMVLRAPDRGGCKNKRREGADVRSRCRAWLEGERRSLWKPPRKNSHANRAAQGDAQKEERACAWVKEGLLGKACSALCKEPPVDVSGEVLVKMRELHPAARDCEAARLPLLRPVDGRATEIVGEDVVDKAIGSFPRGSAASLSGLRPQHLKDALVPGHRDEVLRQTTGVVELLSKGEAHPGVGGWICGGSLTALRKKDGGLRPFAVGETWRRLVAKTLAATTSEESRKYFQPLQLGVGSKCGCEAIVHVVRQWLGRNNGDSDRVLVSLDLSNAFNCLDRSALRAAVRRVFPGLAPWVDFCYGEATPLILGLHRIDSTRGIQQGDPLGPLLFAVAIHDAIQRARRDTMEAFPDEPDFVTFYVDDGVFGGTSRAAKHFCDQLERLLSDIGLSLQKGKCEVVPSAGLQHQVPPDTFLGFHFNASGNFKLLGASLGTADFCLAHTRKRVTKASELLAKISQMRDSQCALHLMRNGASFCKLVYSARTVPTALLQSALHDMSDDVKRALTNIVGTEIDPRGWKQAQIGIKSGGLGLRSAEEHASSAFIACVSGCAAICSEIDPHFDPEDIDGHLFLQEARQDLSSRIRPDAVTSGTERAYRQKHFSRLVDAKSKEDLSALGSNDLFYKAHLALQDADGAGAWLTALPEDEDRKVDPALFQVCLQRRLRLRVQEADSFCPLCGMTMDSYGDHALVCRCHGDKTIRHNVLRNVVYSEALLGGMRPEKEKAGLLPGRPAEDGLQRNATREDEGAGVHMQVAAHGLRRPADVFLPRGACGAPTALDFACTSGLRADRVRLAAEQPEQVASRYEDFKRNFKPPGEQAGTEALCAQNGLRFVPMVLEAHGGGWSAVARQTLDVIARSVAAAWNEKPEVASLRIAQRLSTTLHRENARAILKRCRAEESGDIADELLVGLPPLW